MSSGELERVEVMGRVGSGDLKLRDAAVILELSYRQTKRLWRRYRQVGSKGLKHGNAGRASNRSKPQKLRRRVLNLIRKKYSGSEEERFGPTLAAEHLAEEDGIVLDHETLRLWMLAERLWSRQRKRKKHCQRRERKSHFGELVQLDGSFHDWLEGNQFPLTSPASRRTIPPNRLSEEHPSRVGSASPPEVIRILILSLK